MSKNLVNTLAAAGLALSMQTAYADIYFVNSYMDKGLNVAVIGDANKLGVTNGFANDVPYSMALKLLLPDWKVLNRLNHYPKLYVTWTKGTPKIEILKEMNKRGKLFFYVDEKHKEITVDWKPSPP